MTGKTARARTPTQYIFRWEGKDREGRILGGEMRAESIAKMSAILREQDLSITKSKHRRTTRGKKITPENIAYLTCQLSTMLKVGMSLLQSIDIIVGGHANSNLAQLLTETRVDIESGSGIVQAFRHRPKYFDTLYCNLIDMSEQGGILDALLERLSLYMERSLALKTQIKSTLIYPISVLTVVFLVIVVLMILVASLFEGVFSGSDADLPVPTLFVITISDFFIRWWISIVLGSVADIALFSHAFK